VKNLSSTSFFDLVKEAISENGKIILYPIKRHLDEPESIEQDFVHLTINNSVELHSCDSPKIIFKLKDHKAVKVHNNCFIVKDSNGKEYQLKLFYSAFGQNRTILNQFSSMVRRLSGNVTYSPW
jgi:hypothetical protein